MPIIKRLTAFFQKQRFSTLSIPLALLAACVLAFGLLIPWLGYYHDEWHFIYYHAIRGAQGLVDLFTYDGHPLAVWSYIISFDLLGVGPLGWHIYALLWRWLAVSLFWLCLDRLWPDRKRFTFIAALLFAVYPIFVLQVLPISYFEVWISFFLLWLSFYWMLEAVRQPHRFWLFTALAIAAKFGHMFTSEYTWGLELIRPLFIWFFLPTKMPWREKLIKAIQICLPYFILLGAIGGWRGLIYQAGRKEIGFQTGILYAPLQTAIAWIQHTLPDLALVLFTSWYDVLQPSDLFLGSRFNLVILGLSVISGVLIFFYLQHLPEPAEERQSANTGLRAAVLISLTGLIVGTIPSYTAGYTIYLSAPPGNTRFALGVMPAAALLISALLELLISSNRARLALVAILTGLSIGWHVRYTSEFRDLWKYQVNFYRQLTWRVPAMKPGTALVSMGEFFPPIRHPSAILAVSGDYPTAMAINTIYGGKPGADGKIPYWFFQSPEALRAAPGPLYGQHLDANFAGEPKQSLLFSYRPQDGQCLQIFSPADAPVEFSGNFPPASLEGIDTNTQTDFSLLDQILGPADLNNWCYFYEKAELARQRENWQAIAQLWEAATAKNLRPADGREYLPFVVSFAKLDDWKQALTITRAAGKTTRRGADIYCQVWGQLENETQSSTEKETALAQFREIFPCQRP